MYIIIDANTNYLSVQYIYTEPSPPNTFLHKITVFLAFNFEYTIPSQ